MQQLFAELDTSATSNSGNVHHRIVSPTPISRRYEPRRDRNASATFRKYPPTAANVSESEHAVGLLVSDPFQQPSCSERRGPGTTGTPAGTADLLRKWTGAGPAPSGSVHQSDIRATDGVDGTGEVKVVSRDDLDSPRVFCRTEYEKRARIFKEHLEELRGDIDGLKRENVGGVSAQHDAIHAQNVAHGFDKFTTMRMVS